MTLAEGTWLAAQAGPHRDTHSPVPPPEKGLRRRQGPSALPHHSAGTAGISTKDRQGFTKSAVFTGQYLFVARAIYNLFIINHYSHRQLNQSVRDLQPTGMAESPEFLFFSLLSPAEGRASVIFLPGSGKAPPVNQ